MVKKDLIFNRKSRLRKAKKILRILNDQMGDLSNFSCLDVGCAAGFISYFLAPHFKYVIGVDINTESIKQSQRFNLRSNLSLMSIGQNLPFKSNTFDVVIFNQVYEHCYNPQAVINEIRRVLKTGGYCFFGARNKYAIFDGHFPIPFLAWIPRQIVGWYDINLYSLACLNELVKDFQKIDYTLKIIDDPQKFAAKDVVPTILGINKLLGILGGIFYSFIPNYLWILRKNR